jgi:hypothetical protein
MATAGASSVAMATFFADALVLFCTGFRTRLEAGFTAFFDVRGVAARGILVMVGTLKMKSKQHYKRRNMSEQGHQVSSRRRLKTRSIDPIVWRCVSVPIAVTFTDWRCARRLCACQQLTIRRRPDEVFFGLLLESEQALYLAGHLHASNRCYRLPTLECNAELRSRLRPTNKASGAM